MKKLFVSALAILGLVACVKDDVVSVHDSRNPIGFDTHVENVTRVGYNTDNLDGFYVWAFLNDLQNDNEDLTKGFLLNGECVTRNDQGVYNYQNTQYWIPGNTYYFYALAPIEDTDDDTALIPAMGDDAKKGLGKVIFTNVDGTKDLIYSAYSVYADGSQDKVNFQFNHLLSKVKFSFENGFADDNYNFTVSNIKMTAPESASIDLTAGAYTWGDHTGEITLVFGDNETPKTSKDKKTVSSEDRLTIPAGATQEYNVTFDVNLYVAGTLARTYNKEAKISGIEFVAGKGYSLTATINAETFNLETINFDATVEGWDETSAPAYEPYQVEVAGVSYDDLAEACGVAMDSNNPVNFFQHVVVDADTTITVPAGKTLTLNLNGYTLTGVTDQTGSNRNMFDVRGIMNVNGAPISRASVPANGTISVKHIGTDMGWGASTNVFNVTAGGVLNIENVTAKNLGGSAMAFVAHLNNWGECTLNVNNSTLESTYIAVRVFNSGYDMNNVTIAKTELKGKYCFWVHNYKEAGDSAGTDATLNLNIYNPDQENTFTYTSKAPVLFGFANPIYFDAYGNELIAEGVGYDETTETYTVSKTEGLAWIAEQVDNGETTFEGQTIKLVEDIDLTTSSNWNPIGDNRDGQYAAFSGTFDGNNKTITGAHITGDHCFNGTVYGSKEGWGLFSVLDGATVKDLKVDGATFASYTVISGTIAGYAKDTTFENIDITNTKIAGYNWYTGGVVGWAQGECTFKDINLDDTVYVGTLWDSHGQNAGGIAGGVSSTSKITIEDCNIACVMDVINDITSNYKWHIYRVSGMIIGNTNTTEVKYNEVVTATATNVTCNNVTVTYGDWMNYHYCEGYWNRGWGRYESSDYVGGVDQNEPHNHADGESHYVCIPFDQLFGGSSNGSGHYPVKGLAEFPGVTVNYPASYRREVSTAAALTDALNKGLSVILDSDIDFGSTQLAITGENQVVDLNGKALTTANNWGGISLKNGATIKNGTITHAGNTAAIKAFNGTSIENVTINATCSTADKTVTGIAVQQGAYVESIKNVTINGVSQGIEVGYQATVDLIENAVVNESNNGTAKGIGLVINGGMVGKAKDCTFKGETYGITLHLKGVFDAGLELENCDVEGTTASICAWDEKGISNTSGSLVLTYDAATTLTGPFVWDFEDECQSVVTLNKPN
ncbi:MAG: fimbrillin family protein [Alistipes sp.]|nr:fimbrillin family protein [Alistipes sp.]